MKAISTNLANWEKAGLMGEQAGGSFEFEDANSVKFPNRFYRVVSP